MLLVDVSLGQIQVPKTHLKVRLVVAGRARQGIPPSSVKTRYNHAKQNWRNWFSAQPPACCSFAQGNGHPWLICSSQNKAQVRNGKDISRPIIHWLIRIPITDFVIFP